MTPPPATPDCRSFPALLDDYLDGDTRLRPVLVAHTATCASCAAEMRLAEKILNRVAGSTPPAVDAVLVERILAAVGRDRPIVEVSQPPWKAFALVVGALAACFVIGVSIRPAIAPARPTVEVARFDPPASPRVEPIGERLSEASDLLVQLTRRRTSETVTAARTMLPDTALTLEPLPTELPAAGDLQTAADSVRTVGRNAVMCFEPLTRSAENALSFLRREVLPPDAPH